MHPISPELVSGYDTVIHLSGENVAGRWTAAKKRRIRDSRVLSTQNMTQALVSAGKKPAAFLCASAIGFYGNRADEILTEESPAGEGFLPEVCREWESAAATASDAGIRVVNLRFGIVLSRHGGALKEMLLPFRLGLGGKIGSGRQWWSWIHIDDAVSAVHYILQGTVATGKAIVELRAPLPGEVLGAINLVSPNPATNAEFTRTLAHSLRRPAFFTIPAVAARIAFGELADEGLLASVRVIPKMLTDNRFEFRYPTLAPALSSLLRR